MKKNKLLMLCLGLILGVTTFTFAGCANEIPGGGDDGGGVESGGGNQGGSGGGGTETPDPEPTDPVKQAMSVYFSGMKATYQKASVQNENKQSVAFNEVLDRQIDVLAQDLIYRLTYVYGYNNTTHNRVEENSLLILKNLDNSTYSFLNNKAVISSDNLISEVNNIYTIETLREISINKKEDFQKSLIVLEGNNNYLLYSRALNLSGAVEGFNMSTIDDGLGNISLTQNINKSWKLTSAPSNYETYSAQFKDTIKLGIAKILSGKTSGSYESMLNSINTLGFTTKHQSEIVDFIYKDVIGQELVNKDNEYADYFKNNHNGIINSTSIIAINNNSSFNNDNNPRFYKGYSVVIPAMVEQALNNTFESTETSIYPTLNRYAVQSYDNANGVSTSQNYSSIVLMPKGDTPTTRLVLKMQGDGESVGKTIMINFEIKTPSRTYSASQQVTLSNVEQEVELNLYALTNGAKLNAYNGGKENYNKTELFGAESEGTVKDGDNYIKLSFANTNNSKFIVKFDGLYDKMYRS